MSNYVGTQEGTRTVWVDPAAPMWVNKSEAQIAKEAAEAAKNPKGKKTQKKPEKIYSVQKYGRRYGERKTWN